MIKEFTICFFVLFFTCNKKNKQEKVLSLFDTILNTSVPSYKEINDEGFYHTRGNLTIGYTVHDLTDTLNIAKQNPFDKINEMKFIQGHFYHFVPVMNDLSKSNIAYIGNDSIIIFNSINCPDGDNIETVLNFAKKRLTNRKEKTIVLKNLKNYRKWGYYVVEDLHSLSIRCD